jgi:hypothetical protein
VKDEVGVEVVVVKDEVVVEVVVVKDEVVAEVVAEDEKEVEIFLLQVPVLIVVPFYCMN